MQMLYTINNQTHNIVINSLLLFAVNMELTTLICLLLIAHDFN